MVVADCEINVRSYIPCCAPVARRNPTQPKTHTHTCIYTLNLPQPLHLLSSHQKLLHRPGIGCSDHVNAHLCRQIRDGIWILRLGAPGGWGVERGRVESRQGKLFFFFLQSPWEMLSYSLSRGDIAGVQGPENRPTSPFFFSCSQKKA